MTTWSTRTREKIAAALQELVPGDYVAPGLKPMAVAGILRSAGVTGVRSDALECPVSRFVAQRVGVRIVTSTSRCYARGELQWNRTVPLPWEVSEFVRFFDNGAYQDLRDEARAGEDDYA